jgi:hypothetical protein
MPAVYQSAFDFAKELSMDGVPVTSGRGFARSSRLLKVSGGPITMAVAAAGLALLTPRDILGQPLDRARRSETLRSHSLKLGDSR